MHNALRRICDSEQRIDSNYFEIPSVLQVPERGTSFGFGPVPKSLSMAGMVNACQ